MTDPIRELKVRAAILHRRVTASDPSALPRLRLLPEFSRHSLSVLEERAPRVLRRQCLSIVAREFGFGGWSHARAVIGGRAGVSNFGTLLYPARCGGFLNLWYRTYDDAALGWRESGGYLIAYGRQFVVVRAPFIKQLGLDPEDPDWGRIGFDWVRPRDLAARTRLYGELIGRG